MTTLWEEDEVRLTRGQRFVALIRKQPSAILLAIQFLVILLLPWLQQVQYGRVGLSMLSAAALVIAVVTVRSTPALTWLSIVLMVPAMGLEFWAAATGDTTWVAAAAHFALAVFYFYTAYGLISYMFADAWVTKDELFAVGACFTVLVFAFAYLLFAIQEMWPGSFSGFHDVERHTFLDLLFFSTANFTSVGLSDIIAVSPHARAATIIEQLSGVMYVAMVISRLVALTVMRARS